MSSSAGISAELREFIEGFIDSVEMLEVLLALREDCTKLWTCEALSSRLRSSAHSVQSRLDRLVDLRLAVQREGTAPWKNYSYAAQPPELEQQITQLQKAYRERRVAVISMIYQNPRDKLKSFSQAFQFIREPEDG